MKHVLKSLIFGAFAYLVIRFFVRVATDKNDNGKMDTPLLEHATGTILEVIGAVAVVIGIATDPQKWGTAKDVVLSPVTDSNYGDKWGTLVALAETAVPEPTGAEKAQV